MHLHGDDHHQVHDGDGGEAEDETVGLAVAVQLLRHGEHLHPAVQQGRDAEQPGADHADHQVADVVARQGKGAEERGQDAQQVGVLPLVRSRHRVSGHQVQLAHRHLGRHQEPDQHVNHVQLPDLRLQRHAGGQRGDVRRAGPERSRPRGSEV